MKVQFDVDETLWRDVKAKAALAGSKLNAFVSGALRQSVGVPVRGAEVSASGHSKTDTRTAGATPPTGAKFDAPVNEDYEVKHECALCHDVFSEFEMTYHAKTMKWACDECVEKQKNNQG